jgi:pimeloyl-ACP methyl ester carboxylesterase
MNSAICSGIVIRGFAVEARRSLPGGATLHASTAIPMPSIRRAFMTILTLAALGYGAICALLFFGQDSLIFFPRRAAMADLASEARAIGFEPWTNSRGERIGWQSVNGDPANVLLVCHGNGGYALHRNYFAYASRGAGSENWKTFLLEYPGYGARGGVASESSLTAAAVDAVDALAGDPKRRIRLLGQSLGSGVACAAAAARPGQIDGLILMTPFNSLAAAAHFHYPWLPVPLLVRHRFDSAARLRKYHGPVAFILAGDDQTVPPALGRKLFDAYSGPKQLWVAPHAGHNDTDRLLADWSAIIDWLRPIHGA